MSRFDFMYSAIRIAAVVSVVQAPGLSHVQPTLPGGVSGIYTIERETRERWMNARQLPIHTPRTRTVSWIAIDSFGGDFAGRRVLFGRAGDLPSYGEPVRLTLRADGHALELDARVRPSPGLATARTARDSLRMSRFGLVDGPFLRLPKTRLWDVASVFRPARLQRGEQWVDTLAYSDEFQDLRQSLTGVRTYV